MDFLFDAKRSPKIDESRGQAGPTWEVYRGALNMERERGLPIKQLQHVCTESALRRDYGIDGVILSVFFPPSRAPFIIGVGNGIDDRGAL